MINTNKGMFIECLVEKTISFFNENKIGCFEKRHLPIAVCSINKNKVIGKLKQKSTVDFCGIYLGKHIEFETKQTDKDYFNFNLFKEHQIKYLIDTSLMGGISFVIIHFFKMDKSFAISIDDLIKLKDKFQFKNISYEYFKKNYFCLELVFPGILMFNRFIDQYIKK